MPEINPATIHHHHFPGWHLGGDMQEPDAVLHGPEHRQVLEDGLLHLQGQDPEVQAQLQRWVHEIREIHEIREPHSSLLCRVLHTGGCWGARRAAPPLANLRAPGEPGQEWGSPQGQGKPGTQKHSLAIPTSWKRREGVTGFTPSRPRNPLEQLATCSKASQKFTHPFAGRSRAPQPRSPQPQAEHQETQPQTDLRRGAAEGQLPGNTMELKLKSRKSRVGNFTSTHHNSPQILS